MRINKKGETLRNVIGQICTVLSVLFVILYTVVSLLLPEIPNFFNKESLSKELNYIIILVVFSGTMLFVLPCVIIINNKWNRDKLTEGLNEITEKLKISKNIVDKITSSFIIKKAEVIKNKDDFFDALDKAINNASEDTEIRLINFEKSIKEQRKNKSATEKYYQEEMEFYRDKKNIKLFKIVSIHTKEKFKECFELVKQAEHYKLENFNLAYLHIGNFEEVTLPKIIGVQIIDDTVIFMNPISARIDTADHQESILIESEDIAQIYSEYHRKIWEGINNYHKQWLAKELTDELKKDYKKHKEYKGYVGHFLYLGEKGTTSEERVWRDINNDLSEREQLKDYELTALLGLELPQKTIGGLLRTFLAK